MELHEIKKIIEVKIDAYDQRSPESIDRVNQYLKENWGLLAIHNRGYRYENDPSTYFCTVYILGSTEDDNS